jgi:ribosomal protein L32
MGAGVIAGAANAAVANAQWKSAIKRGMAVPNVNARPAAARSKCPGCGSWELSATKNGPVCSYCRVPAGREVSP